LRDRISYSEWQLWRNTCQQRWNLDYNTPDLPRRVIYSVHFDFGTSIHEAIEIHRARKNSVDLRTALEHFKKKFDGMFDTNFKNYGSDKDKEEERTFFQSAGKNILENLHKCQELAEATVVYNEHELILPIDRTDGTTVNFKGFIDMVIKTKSKTGKDIIYIIDFKSCSWGWDQGKKQDEDVHAQLLLYKHFFCKKFDLEPTCVRCAFVLLKKKPAKGAPVVEFFPVSAGPVAVQRALNNLNSDLTSIDERMRMKDFIKNRNMCIDKYNNTCPYYNSTHCPGTVESKKK